jgi:hypothetical protein
MTSKHFCLAMTHSDEMEGVHKKIIHNAAALMYKILAHHECYKVVEKVKRKKKCSCKGRALRAQLCDKSTL